MRVGRNVCRESGSFTVRANIGALVPPLGAFILLRSVMIEVCVVVLGAGDARGGLSSLYSCGHGAKIVGEKIRATLFFEFTRSLLLHSLTTKSPERIMHPTLIYLGTGRMFEI